MKVQELRGHRHLVPQKLTGRETPHATIEPNTTCNIRCRHCYAIEQPEVKALAQVEAEIELALAKRNLDALSLLGGEPTLHPEIVEIVRFVKSKGLICMLLTNGVRFLRGGDLALLDALVDAGVDRFLVHIDSNEAHGSVQICWQCPDATIRNGKLTPVCLAGRINPLGGRPPTASPAVIESGFRHLGEA